MPTPTGPYTVEAHYPETGLAADRDHWIVLVNDRLEFCRGFMAAQRDDRDPHPALRLVRIADGRVMEQAPRRDEQGVGMVAGWATGVQMLDAARRLLGRVQPQRGYVTQEEADIAAAALRVLTKAADAVEPVVERSCFTCKHSVGPLCAVLCGFADGPVSDVYAYCRASGVDDAEDNMPTDRTIPCPGHSMKGGSDVR